MVLIKSEMQILSHSFLNFFGTGMVKLVVLVLQEHVIWFALDLM